MRRWVQTHARHPGFGSNPMPLGIAVALADLYDPMIPEARPDRWTDRVATFAAGSPEA